MIETASAPAPRVLIAQGELAGLTDRGIHNFRGIPYAQPPVGALRWAPPQPPTGWEGARDATAFLRFLAAMKFALLLRNLCQLFIPDGTPHPPADVPSGPVLPLDQGV